VNDYEARWWEWFNATSIEEMAAGAARARRHTAARDDATRGAMRDDAMRDAFARAEADQARRRAAIEADRREFEARQQAIAERRQARLAAAAPPVLQRRSRTDWAELTGDGAVAKEQIAWERRQTVRQMRRAGMTYGEIGAHFGISTGRAQQMGASAERCANNPRHRSPVEAWMDKSARPDLGDAVRVRRGRARALVGTLNAFAYAPHRDWLLVGSNHG
jgi:hypothetical protein